MNNDTLAILENDMKAKNTVLKKAMVKALRKGASPDAFAEEKKVALAAYRKYWSAVDAARFERIKAENRKAGVYPIAIAI